MLQTGVEQMNNPADRRLNMVNSQILTNRVTDQRIADALLQVPREAFVPKALAGIAYMDDDLHVGEQRYLMEPMIFARMVQAADIASDDLIIDIGCASGYSTAVLARLGGTVVALECDDGLAETANRALNELEIDNAAVVVGPLAEGLAKQGPYDVIFVGGRIDKVPRALLAQLKEGGRLIAVENAGDVGKAVIYVRIGETTVRRELFDANTKSLPGFEKPAAFSF